MFFMVMPIAEVLSVIGAGKIGQSIIRALVKTGFDGKIILATGSFGEDVMNKAIEAGCDDVIVKPVKIEELKKKIWKYFPKASGKRKENGEKEEISVKPTEENIEEEVFKEGYEEEKIQEIQEEELVISEKPDEEGEDEIQEEFVSPILEKAVQKMIDEMGMDREVALGMIGDYVRFLKRKHKSLVESLLRSNDIGIRRVAHDLAGSGEMYGFEEISEMGQRISQLVREKNYEEISKIARELEKFIENIEMAMKRYQIS
jgi:YesN/AraC family two-component response regulator